MFFDDKIEFTKYGYYSVGNQKTLSKFEAWQLSNKDPERIQFHYNPDLVSGLDWSSEPELGINHYYKLRAEQLRNDYDYVVLMYSGGIDSHVILETFLKNHIHLDEVVCAGNRQYLPVDAKFNQEIFKTAIPYIENADLARLGTQFTYVDIGQLILDQFALGEDLDNFFYLSNGVGNVWSYALRGGKFKLMNQHHVALSEQGKKICYLWGFDKPNLTIENNQRVFSFYDSISDAGPKQFYNRKVLGGPLDNFYDETFFICREALNISVKQVLMLVNKLKGLQPGDTGLCTHTEIGNTGPFVRHSEFNWLKKTELEKVIYPDAPHHMFGNDKLKGSVMFTPRDRWFWSSNHPNRNRLVDYCKKVIRENENFFYYKNGNTIGNSIIFKTDPVVVSPINLKEII